MYHFNILEIAFTLQFTGGTPLPLSANLQEYLADTSDCRAPTTIQFVNDPIVMNKHGKPLGHATSSITMTRHDSRDLYCSYMYQILADSSFKEVILWSPHEAALGLQRENRVAYDGHPTLLFIVWGRAVHENLCFFHGALNCFEGNYFLLSGSSGVGKTTLSNLFCAEEGTCLTEENPYLGIKDGNICAFSTPWPGRTGKPVPDHGGLKGIFFLHHNRTNRIQKLSFKDSIRQLIHNSRTFNWQPETIPDSLELIESIASHVPCYEFGFVPDKTATHTIKDLL